jgi:hypothetical protein
LFFHIEGGTKGKGVAEYGAERDEITGEWRKLHKEELNGIYSLTNIIRVVK